MHDDQERLVANALRAQATSSGLHVVRPAPAAPERPPSLSIWWVLLLAVLLGLAAGTVVGVFTLR
ncbi:hypothetical protein [Umezawaea tangerina]|uniref:Uncharacterized protein n=1 Tax=Umezawaea tangerina TaxID=84725 RepID=A0A2T0SGT9_9PSEU|nr:hypothetical protein [Umezawaea tangerina]PRY32630.1 hypothetical protein CLV43_12049 [Umezawaea tangerina]